MNLIAAVKINADGGMDLMQNINCGGENPRGLCLSPDGRFLFSLNVDSGTIATFVIHNDGALEPTGKNIKAKTPGNMKIISFTE
jgi:6-phosphogluconolactonase (cycloisomerase 2 family)